jgi:hypothetical protein
VSANFVFPPECFSGFFNDYICDIPFDVTLDILPEKDLGLFFVPRLDCPLPELEAFLKDKAYKKKLKSDLENVKRKKYYNSVFDCSIKCMNDDSLKLSLFRHIPEREYKQLDDKFKVRLADGLKLRYTFDDAIKRLDSRTVSVNRSRRTIKMLSDKNRFYYFLTVTFNQKYVDRDNAFAVQRTFKAVIKRLKRIYSGVAYVCVPEFHKDKENIHFHLMFNCDKKLHLHRKGRSERGQTIFYLTDDFKKEDCFIIVEKLDFANNVDYLLKYITKGNENPLVRRFSCTRNLNRLKVLKTDVLKNVDKETDINLQSVLQKYNFETYCRFKTCHVLNFMPHIYADNLASHDTTQTGALARQLALDLSNENIKCRDVDLVYSKIIEIFEKYRRKKEMNGNLSDFTC